MKIIKIIAFAFIAAAPTVLAQPAPAEIMARTVCFDGIRAFQAAFVDTGGAANDAAERVQQTLKMFVPASDTRAYALRDAVNLFSAAVGPVQRAEAEVRLCAATVGAAADRGMRSLDDFKRLWANERTTKFKLGAPVDPSAPNVATAAAVPRASASLAAPPQLTRNARRVCASEITAYQDVLLASGDSAAAVKNNIDDIVVSFLEDAEPRAHVINDFDEMSRQPGAGAGGLQRLAASACVATMGTLWSVGMRSFAEMNGYWAGHGRARFALAELTVQPTAASCIWMDWDAEGAGSPGTLRNSCPFTIDLRFCMTLAKAGSATEAVDCDKGRSRFERIEARSGVHTALTEGVTLRWTACKAPLQPVDTTEPGGSFKATCK